MCQNATKTAASLMLAIEPTIKSLLSLTGQTNTPEGIAAINAYNAALAALQNWVSGTPAQTILELLAAFQSVFNTLPLPTTFTALANIILAGIETVIGVLTANSPAPVVAAPAGADATPEETQAAHVAHSIADTTAKVQVLVPGFKRSIWHSAATQYNNAWNSAVDAGGFPQGIKVA